jgi:sugar O-acyltransferase (sialic acid O-acetyltransferase NeuD family)
MKRGLAIYGAGGLGREMALLIQQLNEIEHKWNLIGFFDDQKSGEIDNLPVLGGIKAINAYPTTLFVLIGVADPIIKLKLISQIKNPGIQFPSFLHPRCQSGSITNQVGRGTILTAGCILTTGIILGDFIIVNLNTTIGHDVEVGDFSSIMPSVNISGNTKIGKRVYIGAGATILQNLEIGDDCIIGAGAVVTHSIAKGQKVMGVPARNF